jgi:cation diffusion facilitator CzcD-associated flavoprotein CzcO
VGIIGAGMSGIGMAAKLRMAGIDSFHLYEQWDDLGGTWHANTYPGLFCDIASRYYQYTFAPNPDWSYVYSPGGEIWAYLNRVADEYGVRAHTSLRTRVKEAEWTDGCWRLRTEDGGEEVYDFVITAAGGLVHTRKPALPGLESFAGASFHSAEWDHSVALEGRRIGVIGTGSTGMQITRALAPVAGRFELYQRTPQWIFPLPNRRYTRIAKWLYRRFPALNRVGYRWWQAAFEATFGTATVRPGFWRWFISTGCRLHLRRVRDPQLRRRFTPKDEPMCKRLLMGTGFYHLFECPTVDLVDEAIDHVEPRGVVTRDGVLHELDVIVLATGFDAHAFVRPMELIGPGGLRLSQVWDGEPYGYRSVALPGFPNVLMLIGPHSPFGNQSLFTISETQMDFAMGMIERWRRGEVDAVAPTREATDRFNAEVRAALPQTVWTTGCKSWYLGKDGLPHAWPWTPKRHREILAEPEWSDWEVQPGPAARERDRSGVASAAARVPSHFSGA